MVNGYQTTDSVYHTMIEICWTTGEPTVFPQKRNVYCHSIIIVSISFL